MNNNVNNNNLNHNKIGIKLYFENNIICSWNIGWICRAILDINSLNGEFEYSTHYTYLFTSAAYTIEAHSANTYDRKRTKRNNEISHNLRDYATLTSRLTCAALLSRAVSNSSPCPEFDLRHMSSAKLRSSRRAICRNCQSNLLGGCLVNLVRDPVLEPWKHTLSISSMIRCATHLPFIRLVFLKHDVSYQTKS